jgi:RimJ/RimL family protein N-acetyltransferase
LEDLGFSKEGKRRKIIRSKADGKIHDDYCYGLLKEDWKH